jgi:hypothetical protein
MSVAEERDLVRPLRVLERLIKEELDAGDQAAKAAAEPHYRNVAPLLLEAKEGHFRDNASGFYDWAQKKFGKSRTTISTYLAYGIGSERKSFKNLHEFQRTPKEHGGLGQPYRGVMRSWAGPVDDIADRARKEAFRLAQDEALSRAEEREAERKLASRLVDIGYKVLAKELHPDKMRGDKSAFQRLVRVRDKLKHSL